MPRSSRLTGGLSWICPPAGFVGCGGCLQVAEKADNLQVQSQKSEVQSAKSGQDLSELRTFQFELLTSGCIFQQPAKLGLYLRAAARSSAAVSRRKFRLSGRSCASVVCRCAKSR